MKIVYCLDFAYKTRARRITLTIEEQDDALLASVCSSVRLYFPFLPFVALPKRSRWPGLRNVPRSASSSGSSSSLSDSEPDDDEELGAALIATFFGAPGVPSGFC